LQQPEQRCRTEKEKHEADLAAKCVSEQHVALWTAKTESNAEQWEAEFILEDLRAELDFQVIEFHTRSAAQSMAEKAAAKMKKKSKSRSPAVSPPAVVPKPARKMQVKARVRQRRPSTDLKEAQAEQEPKGAAEESVTEDPMSAMLLAKAAEAMKAKAEQKAASVEVVAEIEWDSPKAASVEVEVLNEKHRRWSGKWESPSSSPLAHRPSKAPNMSSVGAGIEVDQCADR